MTIRTFLTASRLPAQLFIFPSILLGHALHVHFQGGVHTPTVALTLAAGFALHLFIVFANDVADAESDRQNHTPTPFSGGSRVLIEGHADEKALKIAAGAAGAAALAIGLIITLMAASPLPLIAVLIGMGLLQAYSFSPVRLSYRGFGETLQVAGVGIVLPLFAFLSQGNPLSTVPPLPIVALLPAQFALAMATALPDEPADRRTQKRTSAVILGVRTAKFMIPALLLIGGLFIGQINGSVLANLWPFIFLPAAAVAIGACLPLRAGSRAMVAFVGMSILAVTLQVLSTAWSFYVL